ncbi:hypothetical protein ACQ4PT_066681 [Festuca glaucescens]
MEALVVMPSQRNHRSGGRSKPPPIPTSAPCPHILIPRAQDAEATPATAQWQAQQAYLHKSLHIPSLTARALGRSSLFQLTTPSSLPIPNFSLREKRSVSLDLPPAERCDDVEVRPHAKSAPSSPVSGSGSGFFNVKDTAIATENLRRILQLDIADH